LSARNFFHRVGLELLDGGLLIGDRRIQRLLCSTRTVELGLQVGKLAHRLAVLFHPALAAFLAKAGHPLSLPLCACRRSSASCANPIALGVVSRCRHKGAQVFWPLRRRPITRDGLTSPPTTSPMTPSPIVALRSRVAARACPYRATSSASALPCPVFEAEPSARSGLQPLLATSASKSPVPRFPRHREAGHGLGLSIPCLRARSW